MISRPPPRPLGAILRVITPATRAGTLKLTAGTCVVGSAPDCDLCIPDVTVSRHHVEVELSPEGIRIRDLGSKNGSFYLGHRFESMVLGLGAHVKLGSAEVAVDADVVGLEPDLVHPDTTFRGIIGASLAMRKLFTVLARLDGSLVNVLVTGDSGVGKELIAHAIHQGSAVSAGPMIVVNCGAFPRELVASELFGHKRGAFSGAFEARKGAFDSADGGTLFLDEIGELPLDVQPMLLRALESGEIRPVGGDTNKHVKVRIVAATNRALEEDVRAGRFRSDLYYRLAVVTLRVAPLRERPEDLRPLANAFAQAAGLASLPAELVEQLVARPWPGNVRELRNAVQSYAAIGRLPGPGTATEAKLEQALAESIDVTRMYAEQKEALGERFTKLYLEALMRHTNGHQTAAAQMAGLDRSYLGKLLARYGLNKP
ncbi:MAG: sigma 54-interacting transcriptional regulator [Polyangiaceae bacterium]